MVGFLAFLLEDGAEVLPENAVDEDLLRLGLFGEQALINFGVGLCGVQALVGGHIAFVDVGSVKLGIISM